MYNFGFAQSHSLPKISEGLVGMIDFHLYIHGNGRNDEFKGRVIGFSSRLNTILVPQSFMDWSNSVYAPDRQSAPTRLIVEMSNPAEGNVAEYFESKGLEVDDDKLQAEKTTYFLRMTVSVVMVVGAVISLLSFYILMLSIYLLVQKNTSKLENLLLIGYSPFRVAMPYGFLTIGLNAIVLIIALVVVAFARESYMDIIVALFPQIDGGSLLPSAMLGLSLFIVVSAANQVAIYRKMMRIWKRKDV
jgi:cell division protein FtsX